MTDIATPTDAATAAPEHTDPRTPEQRTTYFDGNKCMLQLRNGDVVELKPFGNYTGVDFSGSVLKGLRVVNATFDDANFTDCVLSYSDFEGSTFHRATFTDVEMETTNFGYCAADNARFKAKEGRYVSFRNARLNFTTFEGCIEQGTFENAKLFVCVFNEVCDIALNLQNAAFIGCHIKKSDVDEHWNVTGLDASCTTFSECKFSKVVFENVNFEGAKFIDCTVDKWADSAELTFEGCNLTRAQIVRCQWRFTEFNKCVMNNVVLQNVFMFDAEFSRCDMNDALVQMGMLISTKFKTCTLNGARFLHANLNGANLDYSTFVGATFEGTAMQGAKMGNSSLNNAHFTRCTFHPHTQWPEGFDIPCEP